MKDFKEMDGFTKDLSFIALLFMLTVMISLTCFSASIIALTVKLFTWVF